METGLAHEEGRGRKTLWAAHSNRAYSSLHHHVKTQTELLCSSFSGIKHPLIMLTDAVGQDSGWGTAGVVCPCSTVSGA